MTRLHDLLLSIAEGEILRTYKPGTVDPQVGRAIVKRSDLKESVGTFEGRYDVIIPLEITKGITSNKDLLRLGIQESIRVLDGLKPAVPFGEDSLLLYWATYYINSAGEVWKNEEAQLRMIGQVPSELVERSLRPGIA